jgi:hypothetical protein
MRIVANDKLIKRNRKNATRLFFFSLVILIFGFFIANAPFFGVGEPEDMTTQLYLVGMPLILIIGFTSTMVSVRLTNLWIRQPRPEAAITEALKGAVNKNSALYHYLHIPARHVLISPQGVFVLVTRFQDGRVMVNGKKWRVVKGPIGALFTLFRLDGIGNPNTEAENSASYIRHIIQEYDDTIPVTPLIVFTDPRVKLTIEDPDVPVLHTDNKIKPNLRDYIKDLPELEQLKGKKLEDFITEFESATTSD